MMKAVLKRIASDNKQTFGVLMGGFKYGNRY